MALDERAQWQLDRTRELYDEFSADMLACAGHTFQCRVVRADPDAWREDLTAGMGWMADAGGIEDGHHVLDAGCGVCGPATDLARVRPAVTIDAVTISPVQVRLGRELVAEAGLSDRISVHEADYHELPFPDDHFDSAMFLETTGYSYDHDKLFAEIRRVLKPGGRVYVKDVYRIETPLTAQQRTDLDAMEALWASGPVCSMSELAEVLVRQGFLDVEICAIPSGEFRYTGAMLDNDGKGGLELNAFGRRFYQSYKDLPTVIGHVLGRAP